ncbi:6058_t:CDS:2, partial [Acaulospora colombiana]
MIANCILENIMQESRPSTRMLKDDPPDCFQASDIGRNGHTPDVMANATKRTSVIEIHKTEFTEEGATTYKAKLAEHTNQSIDEGPTTPNSNDDQGNTSDSINNQDNQADDERSEIFYDPKKHKTQVETRLSTEDQSRDYICTLWISEDFLASDLKSVNYSEPTNIIPPEFTFLEKFLEKRLQRQIVKKLINRRLLTPEVVKPNTYTLNFDALSNSQLDLLSDAIHDELYKNDVGEKYLPSQSIQLIPTTSMLPADFMHLLELEIFNENSADSTTFTSLDLERKKIWGDFARWACFFISPNSRKQFRDHCRRLWLKVKHAYKYEGAQNKPLDDRNIRGIFQRNPADKLYIAEETTKKVAQGIDLQGYRHIFNSQCFKNAFGETVVDFFSLADPEKRKFGSLFADYELDWDHNSNEDEALFLEETPREPKYLPPILGSGNNVTKLKNHRRTHI